MLGNVKNTSQAKFAHKVSQGIEKYAKIGSITLLLTGIIMGILHPYLFKQIWYIASIIIYVAVQPIAAGLLPKNAKRQIDVLENHDEDELPEDYLKLAKQAAPLNNILSASAIILTILMTLKPF